MALPFVRVRHSQALLAEVTAQRRALEAVDGRRAAFHRNATRFAWSFNTSRFYGYSISPEEGVAGAVTTEHVRRGLGADANADAATAELRSYVRLGARHAVLASRFGLAAAWGDPGVRRQFFVGGAGPAPALVTFGSDAFGVLRGFGHRSLAGSRAVTFSLEYRVPLLRIERGHGTWPIFVRTISAAGFVDAANAFDGRFRSADLKRAFGGEVALDVLVGYGLPVTLTAGIALPRDPTHPSAAARMAYVRLGRSF
jgi:outer membrane protein assembly factor BamA